MRGFYSILKYYVLYSILVQPSLAIGQTYITPIGIPAPEFGIEETVESMYGSPHYYTHWVDNSHPNADNTNAPGTPENPMADPWAIEFLEGTVVVLAGGTYNIGTGKTINSSGTSTRPVFFRGKDAENPIVIRSTDNNDRLNLEGSYLIVENLELQYGCRIKFINNPDHISIRKIELHSEGQNVGFASGISGAGDNIVIYDSHIHHLWKGDDNDCHGVVPGNGSKRWWILDNQIHHNSGDAIQATHNASKSPQYIYIGRNTLHNDRENAIDLKFSSDIIISENDIYGYEKASTSDGAAVVIGSDGAPVRSWILFNRIHNSKKGIRIEEADECWVIGNRIYNIDQGAIDLQKYCPKGLYLIHNTVVNADMFIHQYWKPDFVLHVYNNIIVDMSGNEMKCHMNIESSDVYKASTFKNNLFWQNGGDVVLNLGQGWQNPNIFHVFSSTADFESLPFGESNMIGDPLFKDKTNGDFDLQSGSPAIDNGVLNQVYSDFYNLYGVDIKKDYNGTTRPQGHNWEIGAFEYPGDLTSLPDDGIYQNNLMPVEYSLGNYPNPFNPGTIIYYGLPENSYVQIRVYDLLGRKVNDIYNGYREAGTYSYSWEARDDNGKSLSSGVYIVQIRTTKIKRTAKMMYIR